MFTFHMMSQSNYSIFCHEKKVTIQNNIIVMCTVATDYKFGMSTVTQLHVVYRH